MVNHNLKDPHLAGPCNPGPLWRQVLNSSGLLSDAQFTNDVFVTIDILGLQVVQQSSALADKLEQAPSGMMVLLMDLEMFGQIADSFAQQRDLYFRGTGILFVQPVLADDFLFFVSEKSQVSVSSCGILAWLDQPNLILISHDFPSVNMARSFFPVVAITSRDCRPRDGVR
jgi:hypothetical protein